MKPPFNPVKIGMFCALTTGLCYGLVPVFAKSYYETGGDAVSFLFIRNLCAFLAVPVIIALMRQSFHVARSLWPRLLIWCINMMGVYFFYFSAAELIDVTLVIVIFFLYPTYILVLESIFKGEAVGRTQVGAIIAAYLGLLSVVGPAFIASSPVGIFYAFLAGLCMAVDLFLFRRLAQQGAPVFTLMWCSYFFMLAPFTVAVLWQGWQPGSLIIVLVATAVSIIGDLSLGYALKTIGTVKSGALMNLEPVFAVILAAVVLGERLEYYQYAGAAIVFACLFLLGRQKEDVAVAATHR